MERGESTGGGHAPGYLLVVGRITDLPKMGAYSKALPPVYARHGGSYLALGGPGRGVEWVDGPHRDRSVVLARFASLEAVRQFWWSPEYREAKRLREGAGGFVVVGVPGSHRGAAPAGSAASAGGAAPAGSAAPVAGSASTAGAYLLVTTIVRDPSAYELWRTAFAASAAAHGGGLLACVRACDCTLLEGDPAWDRLELAQLPTPAALDSLLGGAEATELRALHERAGLAFVARLAAFQPPR